MIAINTGFSLGSAVPLDERAYLSKAEMLAVNENVYPDYFLAVCSDDGYLYMFNKNMPAESVSATTGKFKLFAGDVSEAIDILNSDETVENSVRYWIKNLASSALYDASEKKIYTFVVDGEDVVLTAEQKAALDAGTPYAVNETTSIKKTDDGYVKVVGEEETAIANPTEAEAINTTTIKEAIDNLAEAAEVTLQAYSTEVEGVTEGYLKTYELFQGENSIGKIDIPKDLVVTEGSVVEIEAIAPVDPETEVTYKVGDETYKAADVADEESKWYGYPTAAGTFIKLVVANQKLPIFINAEDLVDTGALGKVTEDVTANVEVGGIAVGDTVVEGTDITELVKQLLIKYYAPTIKLTSSETNLVQRVGVPVNDVTLTATVGKTSLDITKIVIDGTETTEGVAEGGAFTKDIATIDDTTEFVATTTDGKETVTDKIKYEFVYPYMYGISDTNEITTDAQLALLTQNVSKQGSKTFAYTANNKYCVFVMPAAYADLKSILDPNKFENINSWTKSAYTTVGDSTIPAGESYKIYVTQTKVTCQNFKYSFS